MKENVKEESRWSAGKVKLCGKLSLREKRRRNGEETGTWGRGCEGSRRKTTSSRSRSVRLSARAPTGKPDVARAGGMIPHWRIERNWHFRRIRGSSTCSRKRKRRSGRFGEEDARRRRTIGFFPAVSRNGGGAPESGFNCLLAPRSGFLRGKGKFFCGMGSRKAAAAAGAASGA